MSALRGMNLHLRLLSRLRWKTLTIPGTNLILKTPHSTDFEQWVSLRQASEAFLRPWEPEWPKDDLTKLGFQRRLKAYAQQRQSGWGRTYFLHDTEQGLLIGGISLTRIVHGISHSATLGYWMGVHHANQGHMKKTVPAFLDHAFDDLGLNRVEAACVPANSRSIHLLTSCGFHKEGFAREYLEINGMMEDHVLFARLKSDRLAVSRTTNRT